MMSGPPIDQLALDERLVRTGLVLPMDGPLSPKQVADVIEAVSAHMLLYALSQQQVGRGVGENGAYISQFLTGKLIRTQKRDEIARKLNRWIEIDAETRRRTRPPNFVMTRPARQIKTAAHNVIAGRMMGVVWGPAGIGKTLTAQALLSDFPGSFLLRITEDCRTRGKFLKVLHRTICGSSNQRVSLDAIVQRLKGTNRLLMIDQAHQLHPHCFQLLMDLHDEAGDLPILLIGTVDLHLLVRADGAAADFGQFSSRVQLRVDLLPEITKPGTGGHTKQWITVEELRRMFERGKIKLHPAVAKELRDTANDEPGHLRIVSTLVRLAEAIVTKDDADAQVFITAEILDKARGLLEGRSRSAIPVGQVPNLPIPQEVNA